MAMMFTINGKFVSSHISADYEPVFDSVEIFVNPGPPGVPGGGISRLCGCRCSPPMVAAEVTEVGALPRSLRVGVSEGRAAKAGIGCSLFLCLPVDFLPCLKLLHSGFCY